MIAQIQPRGRPVGLLLIISGVAMLRIGQGINRNGEVLRKIAATIGDKDIPPVGKRLKSVAFWISWTLIGLGVICLLTAIYTFTTTERRDYLPIHKVFISYYHEEDQDYKEKLVKMGEDNGIFIDRSVDTGDIDPHLPPQTIRRKIRDDYLRDSTVTIVLVGRAGPSHSDGTDAPERVAEDHREECPGEAQSRSTLVLVPRPSLGTSGGCRNPEQARTARTFGLRLDCDWTEDALHLSREWRWGKTGRVLFFLSRLAESTGCCGD